MSKMVTPKIFVGSKVKAMYGERTYEEYKRKAQDFKYFIEYEKEVDKAFESIKSFMDKKFEYDLFILGNHLYTARNRDDIKDLVARMKKAGYVEIIRSNQGSEFPYVTFARLSLSHNKRKCYGIRVKITDCGTHYSIELGQRSRICKSGAKDLDEDFLFFNNSWLYN